jgi:hypothetical protein
MWRRYFRFKLVPGVMIHHRFGIDFRSDNLDIEMLKQIVEGGSYYLELTSEGQKELYGEELPEHIPELTMPGKTFKRNKRSDFS